MYETFEHTADLGFRARGPDLESVFADMGRCLFATIIDNPEAIVPRQTHSIEISGHDPDYLLFDWLRDLLLRFDTEHWLYANFDVRIGPHGLIATVQGEPLDPSRHHLSHEVKAITYHALTVTRTPEGWIAEVIVDI
jgi:SHS2 domain-containing protein